MIVGCYTLDLYCDNPFHLDVYGEFPDQYFDEYGSVCMRQARNRGWLFTKDKNTGERIAICPRCSGKKKKGKS
jgi:hypothetical protein